MRRQTSGRLPALRSVLAVIGAGVLFGLFASAVFHWDRLVAALGLLP